MLTVGATTRFLDAETGAEAARFGIAQRLRFSDQRVVMPNARLGRRALVGHHAGRGHQLDTQVGL